MKPTGVLFLLAATLVAQVPAINWEKPKTEVTQHLRALIQIDTATPDGSGGSQWVIKPT